MADTNEEIIGGIGVTITGDYSSLQASYATAQQQAEQAGQNVADAFNSGVVQVSDGAEVVTAALDGIGPAGDGAAAGLGTYSDAAETAGHSSGDAESSLASLAEQLTAVGEALAITEGLREFGATALEASDSITRASIALTTITGSAETARGTIEQLEALGMQDGLAMPSLLTAAQRMQQLLGPGTDVVGLLGMLANGAVAMGTDIGTAADMFDRMAANGMVMSRSLGSVGLTMQGLADAVNQVNPSLDATAVNLTKVFKSMDQEDRIAALKLAFQGLAGVAQQVAEQTFGGQWQQLANAWEQIMVQVGQAMLPVISDLLSLVKTDIAPFLETVAKDFNALPGPVKDTAVAVALAVTALVPLGGLAAAATVGVKGLAEAAALLGLTSKETATAQTVQTTATVAEGAAAGAAAPEVAALGVATETAGAAATKAGVQYDLFAHEAITAEWGASAEQMSLFGASTAEAGEAATVTGAATVGLGTSLIAMGGVAAIAAIGVSQLKDGWSQVQGVLATAGSTAQSLIEKTTGIGTAATEAKGSTESLGSSVKNLGDVSSTTAGQASALGTAFSVAMAYPKAMLDALAQGAQNAITSFSYLTDAIQLLGGVVPGVTTMTAAEVTQLNNLQKEATNSSDATKALTQSQKDAANAASGVTSGLKPLLDSLNAITTEVQGSAAGFKAAQTEYNMLQASFASGMPMINGIVATLPMVNKGFADLQKAAGDAQITLAPIPGSMQAITDAATKLANAGGAVVSSEQEQANEQAVAVSSMDLATKAYNASVVALDSYVSQLHDAQAADNGTVAAQAAVTAAEGNVQKAYAASQKDLGELTTTLQNYITYMNGSHASTQAQIDLLKDLADKFGPATAAALGLTDKIKALQDSLPPFGVQITSLTSGPLVGLQSAYDEATAKVAKFQAQMAAGENVGQQYDKALTAQLNSLIALNVANAEEATGLQGSTDAVNLATIAVAAAQAKYDTLNAAYQTNITLAPQVNAAQKALTAAQNELNKATGDGTTLVNALDAAYPNLAAAAGTATTAIGAQTTALQADAAALQSVAAAVQQVKNDFAAATGQSGGSGGTISGPAGYTGVVTFSAGTLGGLSETLTWVANAATIQADNKAGVQSLYDQGYTPQAIAKATGFDITTICSWLGIGVDKAGETKAGASGSTGAAGTSAGGSGARQSPIIVGGQEVGTTGTSAGSGTTASTPVTTSSGGGTSAIDGGSYPAVTAHQAAGEVWAVSTSGASSGGVSAGGNINEQISTVVNQTSTGSTAGLQQVAGAIGGAVQTLASNGQRLAGIAQSLASTSAATQQLATAVAGLVQRIQTGTGSGTTAQGGGGATIAYGGTPFVGDVNNTAGQLPLSPITGLPTGGGAAGPTNSNTTVNANITVNGASNPTQVAQQVISTLNAQLRTAGARF